MFGKIVNNIYRTNKITCKSGFFIIIFYILSRCLLSANGIAAMRNCNIDNIIIGQKLSFKNASGIDYEVINYQQDNLKLKMEVIIPALNEITNKQYSPLPDKSWVKLEKQNFILKNNGKANTDFYLNIPDNPQFMGKKYQFNIKSYTLNLPNPIAVKTEFYITISEGIDINKLINEKGLNNLSFELKPDKYIISNFPVGRKINLTQFSKKIFEITNQNEQKYSFDLSVRSISDIDDSDFSIEPRKIILEPKQSEKIDLYILIPDEEKYYSKEFNFELKAQVSNQIPEHSKISVITIKTKGTVKNSMKEYEK